LNYLLHESIPTEPQKKRLHAHRVAILSMAILGWLGALNLFLIAAYMLNLYLTLSEMLGQLRLSVFTGGAMIIMSAIALIYGSVLVWRTSALKGGLLNLLAGTLAPIPTYIYFAFFSHPAIHWLWFEPLGSLPLVPAIVSGLTSIYISRSTQS